MVAIAVEPLEVQHRTRASARLLKGRLQLNAGVMQQHTSDHLRLNRIRPTMQAPEYALLRRMRRDATQSYARNLFARFRLPSPLAAAATLAACGFMSAPAASSGEPTPPEVAIDDTRAAALAGTVTDMDTGKPVVGASIALHAPSGVARAATVTRDAGGFSFGAIPPGRYELVIRRIGYRSHDRWLTLRPSQPDTLKVVLEVARYHSVSAGNERIKEPAERTAVWEAALRYLRKPRDSTGEGLAPLVLLADREGNELQFDQDWLTRLVERGVVDGVCRAASAFACPDTATSYFATLSQPFRAPRGLTVVDISLTFVRPDYCREARAQGLSAMYAIQDHQVHLHMREGRWQAEPGDWIHFSVMCGE